MARTGRRAEARMIAKKMIISTQVIGLVKKMLRLPPERINALRMLFSRSGASTKDNSIGADGKLFLFKRYPTMPDRNITMTPYMELLVRKWLPESVKKATDLDKEALIALARFLRSEEHTSELQSR